MARGNGIFPHVGDQHMSWRVADDDFTRDRSQSGWRRVIRLLVQSCKGLHGNQLRSDPTSPKDWNFILSNVHGRFSEIRSANVFDSEEVSGLLVALNIRMRKKLCRVMGRRALAVDYSPMQPVLHEWHGKAPWFSSLSLRLASCMASSIPPCCPGRLCVGGRWI